MRDIMCLLLFKKNFTFLEGIMAEAKKQKNGFVQFLLFIVMSLLAFAAQTVIVTFGDDLFRMIPSIGTNEINAWIFGQQQLAVFIAFLIGNVVAKVLSYILNRKKTFGAVNNLVFSMTVYTIMCVVLIIVETLIGAPLGQWLAKTLPDGFWSILGTTQAKELATPDWSSTIAMILYSTADFLIVFLMEKFVIMNDNLFKKKGAEAAEEVKAEEEEVKDEPIDEPVDEPAEPAEVVSTPVEEEAEEVPTEEEAEEAPVEEDNSAEEAAKKEAEEKAAAEEAAKKEAEEKAAAEEAAKKEAEEKAKAEEAAKKEAEEKAAAEEAAKKEAEEKAAAEEAAKKEAEEKAKAEEAAKAEAEAKAAKEAEEKAAAEEVKEEPKVAPSKAAAAKAAAPKKAKAAGKVEFDLRVDGYHFSVLATNGQLMFESQGFASLDTAQKGLETFKKALENATATVYQDKRGKWRFVINKRYVGEGYKTRPQAEAAIESVKRDALLGTVADFEEDPEERAAFNDAKKKFNKGTDVDWDKALKAPAKTFGKFEITGREDRGYFFTLYANNGQLLYCSRYYASEDSCEDAITTFKKACYLDNFFIDKDKFNNWRFVLKGTGAGIVYVGESYSTKDAAISSSESVKKFAMSAKIVVAEDEE